MKMKHSEGRFFALSEERYRTAFQMSVDAISITNLEDGRYIETNQAFLDITGFTRQEVIGRKALEIGIWADPGDRRRLVEELRAHSVCRDLQAQFRKKNGDLWWGMMSASVIELDSVKCILSITCDISRLKASEQQLASTIESLSTSDKRYRTIFQTSLDFITINHLDDGHFIDCNHAFLDTMGYKREEILGRTSLELNLWANLRDLETFVNLLREHKQCRNLECRFKKKNGEVLFGLVSAAVIELEGVECIVSIMRDISSAKAAEDEIRNLSYFDPLTGLPNRRLLMDRLQQTMSEMAQNSHKSALLFVDLDHFKAINETLSHQVGYLLLLEASRRLLSCAREADTVARLGSD